MAKQKRKVSFNRPFNIKTFKPHNRTAHHPDAPLSRVLDKYSGAELLLHTCLDYYTKHKDPFSEDLMQMAKENYLVSLISELEIFFKAIVNSYVWSNESGYKELLESEHINLYDAYVAFSGAGTVTRESIIAEHFSFHSIPQVESVFDKLTGKRFFKEVEHSESFVVGDGIVDTLIDQLSVAGIKDWRAVLSRAYSRRHVIVHQGLDEKLNTRETQQIGSVLFYLTMAVTFYANDTQKKK